MQAAIAQNPSNNYQPVANPVEKDALYQATDVFHANYTATEDIIVNQGGTDSGKTYAIMQALIIIATHGKAPAVDPIITIVNQSIPDSKKGAYRHAKNIYGASPHMRRMVADWNQSDRVITFKTGWQMEFVSYPTEQLAKQGKRQYSFFNEANGIEWAIFWQVAKRTRIRTFIDYNPTAKFWAHENLIGTTPDTNELSATVRLIISDHRHNSFLSETDHRKTEGIKDPMRFNVYARGITGNVDGLIYTNFTRIPAIEFPEAAFAEKGIIGIDFGDSIDPTAVIRVVRLGQSVYVDELVYRPGIPMTEVRTHIQTNNGRENIICYCDHYPERISELRRLKMMALPANKGAGSLRAGIDHMQQLKFYYTDRSKNLHEEITHYMWVKDKKTGKTTNEPIDDWNHALDAIRYAVYTHYFRSPN